MEGHCIAKVQVIGREKSKKEPAFVSPSSGRSRKWKWTGSQQAKQKCDLQSPAPVSHSIVQKRGWKFFFYDGFMEKIHGVGK